MPQTGITTVRASQHAGPSAFPVCAPPESGSPGPPQDGESRLGRGGLGHEWSGRSPRLHSARPRPGRPSRGGGPDELMGAGRREPHPRAPRSRRSRVVQARAAGSGAAAGHWLRTPNAAVPSSSEKGAARPPPGRGALGPDAKRPRPVVEATPRRGGARRPWITPRPRPAGRDPRPLRAPTGGPQLGGGRAPLAGPSGARGLRARTPAPGRRSPRRRN